jgi:hypothetical protein
VLFCQFSLEKSILPRRKVSYPGEKCQYKVKAAKRRMGRQWWHFNAEETKGKLLQKHLIIRV